MVWPSTSSAVMAPALSASLSLSTKRKSKNALQGDLNYTREDLKMPKKKSAF
jgi:hypothetical protein